MRIPILLVALPATLALGACGGEVNEIPVTNTSNIVPPQVESNTAFRNDEPPEVIEERAMNQDDALFPADPAMPANTATPEPMRR